MSIRRLLEVTAAVVVGLTIIMLSAMQNHFIAKFTNDLDVAGIVFEPVQALGIVILAGIFAMILMAVAEKSLGWLALVAGFSLATWALLPWLLSGTLYVGLPFAAPVAMVGAAMVLFQTSHQVIVTGKMPDTPEGLDGSSQRQQTQSTGA